jgi:hypothetical protein
LQRYVPYGRPLFSLPDKRIDQGVEGYLSPVIQVLTDLQGLEGDIALIKGGIVRGRCGPGLFCFPAPFRGAWSFHLATRTFLQLLEIMVQNIVSVTYFLKNRGLLLLNVDGIGCEQVGVVFLRFFPIGGFNAAWPHAMEKVLADVVSEEDFAGLNDLCFRDSRHLREIYTERSALSIGKVGFVMPRAKGLTVSLKANYRLKIQRAFCFLDRPARNAVGVDHRGTDVRVAQERRENTATTSGNRPWKKEGHYVYLECRRSRPEYFLG